MSRRLVIDGSSTTHIQGHLWRYNDIMEFAAICWLVTRMTVRFDQVRCITVSADGVWLYTGSEVT